MNSSKVSIGDAVSFSWQVFTDNVGFLLAVIVILILVGAVFSGPSSLARWLSI